MMIGNEKLENHFKKSGNSLWEYLYTNTLVKKITARFNLFVEAGNLLCKSTLWGGISDKTNDSIYIAR